MGNENVVISSTIGKYYFNIFMVPFCFLLDSTKPPFPCPSGTGKVDIFLICGTSS